MNEFENKLPRVDFHEPLRLSWDKDDDRIREAAKSYLESATPAWEGPRQTFWRVYLLRCADDSLYCGITVNMGERFKKHLAGVASKYTRSRLPVTLEVVTKPLPQSLARRIEAAVKKLPKNRKVTVLESLQDKGFYLNE